MPLPTLSVGPGRCRRCPSVDAVVRRRFPVATCCHFRCPFGRCPFDTHCHLCCPVVAVAQLVAAVIAQSVAAVVVQSVSAAENSEVTQIRFLSLNFGQLHS